MSSTQTKRFQRAQTAKRRLETAIQLKNDYEGMVNAADRRIMRLTAEYLETIAGVR